MKEGCIDIHDIVLDDGVLWQAMGVHKGSLPDAVTQSLTQEVKERLYATAKPKYCYRIVPEIDFKYGRIIAEALALGDKFAVVIVTLGEEVDTLLSYYKRTDIVKAFIADLIASELAELTSRKVISGIEQTLTGDEKISNAYSPGYCGWALTEQRKLFALFDEKPCGITLTESCLMLPVKSISSVLAIGKNVVKAPYGCEICTKTDCYKKRK